MLEVVDAEIDRLAERHRADVARDLEPALVRLVDDGRVQLGRELRVLAVPVVDPDLDDVHFSCSLLLYRFAPFGRCRDPVRRHRPAGLWRGDAASGAEEARGPWDRHRLDLERRGFSVLSEAHRGADAVVGAARQILRERVACLAGVNVCVDDRRHDRLTSKVHAIRAGRCLHVRSTSDLCDLPSVDDDGRVIDHAPVADDDARTFEDRRGVLRTNRNGQRRHSHQSECETLHLSSP